MSLREKIQTQSIIEITTFLNALSDTERLQNIRSLTKKDLKRLFELAKDNEGLQLDYFAENGALECIHEGKNSLPMFTLFQKRFCRLEDGRVAGYNHGSTMHLIGPGYFIARETKGNSEHEALGSIVIDYYQTPDSNNGLPTNWPPVKENHQGLQRLVYYQMHDFMRKVSDHVSIGTAYQKGKAANQYFILCKSHP